MGNTHKLTGTCMTLSIHARSCSACLFSFWRWISPIVVKNQQFEDLFLQSHCVLYCRHVFDCTVTINHSRRVALLRASAYTHKRKKKPATSSVWFIWWVIAFYRKELSFLMTRRNTGTLWPLSPLFRLTHNYNLITIYSPLFSVPVCLSVCSCIFQWLLVEPKRFLGALVHIWLFSLAANGIEWIYFGPCSECARVWSRWQNANTMGRRLITQGIKTKDEGT